MLMSRFFGVLHIPGSYAEERKKERKNGRKKKRYIKQKREKIYEKGERGKWRRENREREKCKMAN
jgi:hypothetical protein